MDIVQLAAAIFIFGLAFWALERVPLPAQPPWIRRALEVLLALIAIVFLLQHVFGIDLMRH